MLVKGTAFIARRSYLEREFGPTRFGAVLAVVAERDPIFLGPILATTRIPIEPFLRFNDRVVADLYGGDEQSYFRFGEASAVWGLTEGPYKRFVAARGVDEFVASAPAIYRNYFDTGDALGERLGPNRFTLRLDGISPRHVYFEYAICGYFRRGLDLVSGRKVAMRVREGFSRGDAKVHYEFELG
jgi:hypothetical protein